MRLQILQGHFVLLGQSISTADRVRTAGGLGVGLELLLQRSLLLELLLRAETNTSRRANSLHWTETEPTLDDNRKRSSLRLQGPRQVPVLLANSELSRAEHWAAKRSKTSCAERPAGASPSFSCWSSPGPSFLLSEASACRTIRERVLFFHLENLVLDAALGKRRASFPPARAFKDFISCRLSWVMSL